MDTPNNECTLAVHRRPCLLDSRRRLCLHRIRASRHHHHFLFFRLRLLRLFACHYSPPSWIRHVQTLMKVRCCESYDSVLVHQACCPRLSESQPHLTLYIKLNNMQQHSTKTQNRIWMVIFESYLASCLSL